jgi:hypothetical protein
MMRRLSGSRRSFRLVEHPRQGLVEVTAIEQSGQRVPDHALAGLLVLLAIREALNTSATSPEPTVAVRGSAYVRYVHAAIE